MRCTSSRRLLSRFLDGELGPWRRRRLEQHLASCASCRAELEADREVWTLLGAAEPARAPDLLSALEARISQEPLRAAPRFSRWLVPAAYAAALLLFTVAGAVGGVVAAGEHAAMPRDAGQSEYAELLGETPPGLSPVVELLESARTR